MMNRRSTPAGAEVNVEPLGRWPKGKANHGKHGNLIREIREIRGQIKTVLAVTLTITMTMTTSGMFPFFLNTPTRYESVGCDDENFSSLKEYELLVYTDCTNLARRCARAASGMFAFNLTQTTQKTQTIRTLQYNQRDLDKNSQNTHTQACAGLRREIGCWLLAINPATQAFPPSHLGNSNEFDCARFGVGWLPSGRRLSP